MGNQFSKKDETQEEREYLINLILEIRSEKRRVGKECRL